MVRKTR